MVRKAYSAGMVKLSFWFSDFKKTIHLINSGMTLEQIKEKNLEENIYSSPTEIDLFRLLIQFRQE